MYIQSLGPLKEKDKKLAGKPLLLLLYMLVEQENNNQFFSTHKLARLIWQSSYGRQKQKTSEKALSSLNNAKSKISKAVGQERGTKYGVFTMGELALKPETGLRDNHGISCDCLDFLSAIKQDNFIEAFNLYKSPFLEKYSTKDISEDLKTWVDSKRSYFAQLALDSAIAWAMAESSNIGAQLQVAKVISLHILQDFSRTDLIRSFAWLEEGQRKQVLEEVCQRQEIDFISRDYPDTDVLHIILYLSLTDNLPLICSVLTIDSHAIPVIRDALEDFDYENIPSLQVFADHYFESFPKEKSDMLEKLCQQALPTEELMVFLGYFKQVETFEKIPWSKVQETIVLLLERLTSEADFDFALAVINDYKRLSNSNPSIETVIVDRVSFYHSYALERTGNYEEALQLLGVLDNTPEVVALKSSLIERSKNYHEAEVLALEALEKANGGSIGRWTMAMAQTTLARIAFHKGKYIEAISLNRKATEWWKGCGETVRALGTLSNTASYIDFAGSAEQMKLKEVVREVKKLYKEAYSLVDTLPQSAQATQNVRLTLNYLGFQTDYNLSANEEIEKGYQKLLSQLNDESNVSNEVAAKVWYNLGYFYKQIGCVDKAVEPLSKTADIIKHADQMLVGCAKGELALLENDVDLLETAIDILRTCGHTEYCCGYIENLLSLIKNKGKGAISENSKQFYKEKKEKWVLIKAELCKA